MRLWPEFLTQATVHPRLARSLAADPVAREATQREALEAARRILSPYADEYNIPRETLLIAALENGILQARTISQMVEILCNVKDRFKPKDACLCGYEHP